LIWRFTLVLIKINYGQIGDQTGLFYTTNPVFNTSGNRFVRCTGTFGHNFTKLDHMIALWKGKKPIYFGVIRLKVIVTINRIFDNRVVSMYDNFSSVYWIFIKPRLETDV
jgi:hypothetical protein